MHESMTTMMHESIDDDDARIKGRRDQRRFQSEAEIMIGDAGTMTLMHKSILMMMWIDCDDDARYIFRILKQLDAGNYDASKLRNTIMQTCIASSFSDPFIDDDDAKVPLA
ncbi:hypothetical protein Tco_1299128 [Tanacetum coccineum]